MSLVQQFERMCRWNIWANGLVLTALREGDGEPPEALAAFQHIFEAELTWLRRIQAGGDAIPLWGAASMANCEAWSTEAGHRLRVLCEHLDDAYLQSTFSYRNSRGEAFTDRVEEPLLHCLLHSQQYRGEAAATLNAAGARVPDFDYIFWLRIGEPA